MERIARLGAAARRGGRPGHPHAGVSLLTTAQAGAIHGVSRHEVQRLVRLGYLPAQRYGRVWLIQEQDARAYQRGQRGTKRQ